MPVVWWGDVHVDIRIVDVSWYVCYIMQSSIKPYCNYAHVCDLNNLCLHLFLILVICWTDYLWSSISIRQHNFKTCFPSWWFAKLVYQVNCQPMLAFSLDYLLHSIERYNNLIPTRVILYKWIRFVSKFLIIHGIWNVHFGSMIIKWRVVDINMWKLFHIITYCW